MLTINLKDSLLIGVARTLCNNSSDILIGGEKGNVYCAGRKCTECIVGHDNGDKVFNPELLRQYLLDNQQDIVLEK